jgi:hypothetical protein
MSWSLSTSRMRSQRWSTEAQRGQGRNACALHEARAGRPYR